MTTNIRFHYKDSFHLVISERYEGTDISKLFVVGDEHIPTQCRTGY